MPPRLHARGRDAAASGRALSTRTRGPETPVRPSRTAPLLLRSGRCEAAHRPHARGCRLRPDSWLVAYHKLLCSPQMSAGVGADVESLCSKCGDVWHVVVAKDGDKIVKVQCKQCSGYHRYRCLLYTSD